MTFGSCAKLPYVLPSVWLALAACSSTPAPSAPSVNSSHTAIRVDDDGAIAAKVETIELLVDGTSEYRGPPRGTTPFAAVSRSLEVGAHTLEVRLRLRGKTARPSPSTLTTTERFAVEGNGTVLDVELHSVPEDAAPPSGVEVRFRIFLGKLVSGTLPTIGSDVPPPSPESAPPLDLSAADVIVARISRDERDVNQRVTDARAQRDIVKLNCENDKLTQISSALQSAHDEREALALTIDSGDHVGAAHQSALLAALGQRADALLAESDQCIGEEAADLQVQLD